MSVAIPSPPSRHLQPPYFDSFRCLGAECADTCCVGWRVNVDKATYDKYQQCSDPEFQPRFRDLVHINAVPTNHDYATIKSSDSGCPFLAEKLCSIQQGLGTDYLSETCATYPRVTNRVDGIAERSLDLSCPEAARLALTDPHPIRLNVLQTSDPSLRIRDLALFTLQDRRYSLAKRLALIGRRCDGEESTPDVEGSFQESSVDPGMQLRIVLDLIVARVRLDFTPQLYLDLYKEFARGIQIDTNSTWREMGARYATAHREYYVPFMRQHEPMLERYLACYALKTLFPSGSPIIKRLLKLDQTPNPMSAQYMVMASYYAIIKAVLIGIAANYKSAFAVEHVVRVIQSCSRTLEHCMPYAEKVREILASRSITDAAGMDVLTGESFDAVA